MKKLIVFAIAILGFTAVSFGQNTATATATGRIVTAVSLGRAGAELNGGNMNFGSIIPGVAQGTVILDNINGRTVSPELTAQSGSTYSSAHFTVNGTIGQLYTVTLPVADVIVRSGANQMTVNAFTKNASGVLTTGSETFGVGATLTVGISQAVGTYVSDPFMVQVDYN